MGDTIGQSEDMPWKVSSVMEQRYELIREFRSGELSVSELAERYGMSRKTVYKWLSRYDEAGLEGLQDRSSRPHTQWRRTSEEIEEAVVELRQRYPSWGPDKLKRWLERHRPQLDWPARSTIGLILERANLSRRRRIRRHATPTTERIGEVRHPNQVWGIDFKGHFLCGDGSRCDPLTISDLASRYLLLCQVMDATNTAAVQQEMTRVFRQFGLPERIRSDNGSPFGSTGVGGLTRLSVWWIKLGIIPERIEAGKPQQNGSHERMHRTMKQDTAQPPAATLAGQQRRFDDFQRMFNEERSHQALDGATPADRYGPSPREFPERIEPWEYPGHLELRRADERGKIRWKQCRCRLGGALSGEVVGLEPVEGDFVKVWFGPVLLGVLDEHSARSNPRASKANSQWAPLQSPSGLLARRPLTEDDGGEPQSFVT